MRILLPANASQAAKNAIIAKYNPEVIKVLPPSKKGTLDTLINNEIKERNKEYKNEFQAVEADLNQTNTYNNNLDALDENQLADEEKDMNKILTNLETIKTNILTLLNNMTETYMKAINYITPTPAVVAIPPVAVKAVTKVPKKAKVTAPQQPIYTTYESFKKKFEDTVVDFLANSKKYKNFKDKSKHHMTIKSRFKVYQSLSDADKKTFFYLNIYNYSKY